MRHKPVRIAAVIALAVVLLCAIDLGTGSTALSQTRQAVNTTLAWLKSMIVGGAVVEPPAPPLTPSETAGQTEDASRRQVTYAARFFKIPTDDQELGQLLQEQGIELVRVSTDPELYCAAISREQAQSFGGAVALQCFAAPRVTVLDGESAAIALHENTPQGPRGLAVACLPHVSDDGKGIESTISFHDGRDGFEIPNINTESGGAVLIRASGIFPDSEQDGEGPTEFLMCVQVDTQ